MKRAVLTTIISFVTILLITQDHFSASMIGFLVAGAVPGTSVSVPFWAMLVFYCLAITLVVTIFVEAAFVSKRPSNHPTRRLPRRRYTTI